MRADREVVKKSCCMDVVLISIAFPEEIVRPLYPPCIEFAPDRLSKLGIDACELIELIAMSLLNQKTSQKSNDYSRT